MYTPHTVTVYNVRTVYDEHFEETREHDITVLRGVFLDCETQTSVNMSGMKAEDTATLFVPLSLVAEDAISGVAKRFCTPVKYDHEQDKSGLWTLKTGGETFFVKGEVVEPDHDFQWINQHYDNVFMVTRVDVNDFGTPDMQHIEVGGR